MKNWIVAVLLSITAGAALAGDRPSLLIYLNPHEYTHQVKLGMMPYFSVWVDRGSAALAAAQDALAPHFGSVGVCKGNNASDVIVWVKPKLSYNPVPNLYYAKVKAQFHLGDARLVKTLEATGEYQGPVNTVYVQQYVRKAYDAAMQDIARQYAADTALQESIRAGLASDFTRSPCGMVRIVSE